MCAHTGNGCATKRRSASDTSTPSDLPDGTKANVIAWIWARTVTCPNPACGIEMPLVRSWWLGKKKGKEAYVSPPLSRTRKPPSGQRVTFDIGHGQPGPQRRMTEQLDGRAPPAWPASRGVDLKYVRQQGRAGSGRST